MRRIALVLACLLAGGAEAADLDGANVRLRGGHVNAGSAALLVPLDGPTTLGSAGGTAGGSPAVGESGGTAFNVAPGFWSVASALAPDDVDGDGTPDLRDNCIEVPNPSQLDVDYDGFGNACDADYNNDGVVGAPDFNQLKPAFGAVLGDALYDVLLDHNGDGAIGAPDVNVLRASFSSPPGPSGLACAGSVPCTAP
jgi:hypothetical protein